MELPLSYGTRITSELSGLKAMLTLTCAVYTEAVEFFAEVFEKEWTVVRSFSMFALKPYIESVSHKTKKGPNVKYPFDDKFPNFPSYLSRSAVAKAFGAVKSYHSHYDKWEAGGKKGNAPSFPKFSRELPTLYYGNMFDFTNKEGKRLPDSELSEFARVKMFCSQRQLMQDRKLTKKEKRAVKKGT